MSCKKPCSRQQQSKAQLLAEPAAKQLVAAAQGPPVCQAASESQNSDGLLHRHDTDDGVEMVNVFNENVFRSYYTSPKDCLMGQGQK